MLGQQWGVAGPCWHFPVAPMGCHQRCCGQHWEEPGTGDGFSLQGLLVGTGAVHNVGLLRRGTVQLEKDSPPVGFMLFFRSLMRWLQLPLEELRVRGIFHCLGHMSEVFTREVVGHRVGKCVAVAHLNGTQLFEQVLLPFSSASSIPGTTELANTSWRFLDRVNLLSDARSEGGRKDAFFVIQVLECGLLIVRTCTSIGGHTR